MTYHSLNQKFLKKSITRFKK